MREAQCSGEHKHQQLLGGRVSPCQVYTERFCRLICQGVRRELDTIRWRNQLQEVLDISRPFGQLITIQAKLEDAVVPPEEDPCADSWEELCMGREFIDDTNGMALNKQMAIQAR